MSQTGIALIFPGQGSQSVGMLAGLSDAFPGVKQTFEEASDGAGADLWSLSQQGPEVQLNRTEYTQPALLAAGIAVWRVWQAQGGALPSYLAGHSLGEYTALVAAGALSLKDGAHLVRIRGQLMQEAAPEGTGAMAALDTLPFGRESGGPRGSPQGLPRIRSTSSHRRLAQRTSSDRRSSPAEHRW